MGNVAKTGAAELFFDGHAQKAQLAHLGPKFGREFVFAVDLGGHWFDAFLRPAVYHLTHGRDVFS